MKVFKEGKVPVKMWGEGFEASCLEQVINASKLPFAFHHVALMPDGHSGYGAPIGGVVFGRWGKDRGGNADVSESPLAYKSIYDVMDAQKDLVEIITELKPIGVMKG